MKTKGAIVEFAKERLDDLMRAYDKYIETCRYIRMPELYEAVVNMPSVRFWVSGQRAARVVGAILRGKGNLSKMHPAKREMFSEIFNRVMVLRKENPELSLYTLCSIVVEQPAPKFYLHSASAQLLICKAREEWIRKKKERLLLL